MQSNETKKTEQCFGCGDVLEVGEKVTVFQFGDRSSYLCRSCRIVLSEELEEYQRLMDLLSRNKIYALWLRSK